MARWMAMAEEAMVPAVDEGAELRASAEVAEAATVDEAKRRRGRKAKCKRSTWPRCCAQSGACLCARRQPSQGFCVSTLAAAERALDARARSVINR